MRKQLKLDFTRADMQSFVYTLHDCIHSKLNKYETLELWSDCTISSSHLFIGLQWFLP